MINNKNLLKDLALICFELQDLSDKYQQRHDSLVDMRIKNHQIYLEFLYDMKDTLEIKRDLINETLSSIPTEDECITIYTDGEEREMFDVFFGKIKKDYDFSVKVIKFLEINIKDSKDELDALNKAKLGK